MHVVIFIYFIYVALLPNTVRIMLNINLQVLTIAMLKKLVNSALQSQKWKLIGMS